MSRKTGIDYRHVELTPGVEFDINHFWHPTIDAWSPVYRDILEPFNFHKFTAPRLPIDLGLVDSDPFGPSVLRLPIKWGGSLTVKLPKELAHLREEVERLLQYDRWIMGDKFEEFFVHLTIDNSIVVPGTTQRYPGFHGDGLQGGKFKNKLICEHSYIMTSANPTVFAIQPFFVAHLNEDRVNIFKEFDRQVYRDRLFRTRPNHFYLIDPYMVHESPVCHERTERTFVRITVTPAELLTDHNTVNPMFSGQKYPERIEVREFVSDPDEDIPFSFYGISR